MDQPTHSPSKAKWALPFFTIWSGQAFSLLGSQIVNFALIWWLTRTTGSATVLATATMVGLLPQVIISPLAGALVDRWNRRITMMVADSTVAGATLVLAILFLNGSVEIWHVYLLMFVRSAAGSFHWPAMQASTSLMVPKENLSRVQGINQMLQGGMNIAGAPLGALLIAILPMPGVLAIDIGTAMLAVLPLFFVPVPQPAKKQSESGEVLKTSVWIDFKAGLRYIWAWPGLVILLGMATILNLVFVPSNALLPLLITDHFMGGAMQLAGIQSAWGIGAVGGGLLLSVWGGFRRRMLTSMLGLILLSIGSLATGFVPASAFTIAVVAMFVMGFANPIINGPIFAVVQASVDPDMQGRVFTIIISAAGAMMPLGLLIAGPVADWLGVQTWFIIGGGVTLVIALIGLFVPAVINLEDGRTFGEKEKKGAAAYVANPGD